jgi:dTDP-4-dehydrorhamnose reductase
LSFVRSLADVFSLDPGLIDQGLLRDAELGAPRPSNTCLATTRLEEHLGRRPPTALEGLGRMLSDETSLRPKLATIEEYADQGER